MNHWEKLIAHYLSEMHKPEVKDLRLLFGIDNIEPFIDEQMNDRLYWVEYEKHNGDYVKCAGWLIDEGSELPWVLSFNNNWGWGEKDRVRIIHEIIPEGMKYDTTNP